MFSSAIDLIRGVTLSFLGERASDIFRVKNVKNWLYCNVFSRLLITGFLVKRLFSFSFSLCFSFFGLGF